MFCKRALVILLALAALLLPVAQAAAEPPPTPPCRFYGTVLLDGAPVPEGTLITIIIESDTYTTTTPGLVDGQPVYGNSTYAVTVVPLPGTAYSDGTVVIFSVAGYEAVQLGYWETGGNIKIDLVAWTPPPTPSPSPTPIPTATPTPTPSPSPTPMPTAAPTPTPVGPGAGSSNNNTNSLVVALCIAILILCAMFAAYLIWKYRIRPGQVRRGGPPSATEMPGLKWQDRMALKMMSNKTMMKIFTNPTVMKIITWEMKAFIAVSSLFKRRGAPPTAAEPESEWMGGQETMSTEPQGDQAPAGTVDQASLDALAAAEMPGLKWQDRMALKMMSNQTMMKIFTNPTVMKIITWEMKAFIAVSSLFKRKPPEEK